jgi:hypothetical protein
MRFVDGEQGDAPAFVQVIQQARKRSVSRRSGAT